MTDTPPTPALDLVVSALQRAVIDYPALNYVDRARALLQKLAQTNDAVYQRGYAEGVKHGKSDHPVVSVMPDAAGWPSVNECPTCGQLLGIVR